MQGSFNGINGPYRYDSAAAFYRAQEEARREREHTERAARLIAGKLAGRTFDTIDGMEQAVIALVIEWQCDEPDDAMRATIHRACGLLWAGEVTRDAGYRLCVERDGAVVRFLPAA